MVIFVIFLKVLHLFKHFPFLSANKVTQELTSLAKQVRSFTSFPPFCSIRGILQKLPCSRLSVAYRRCWGIISYTYITYDIPKEA